ncbi:hypothetical protein VPH35_016390 [Triticum aestivum]
MNRRALTDEQSQGRAGQVRKQSIPWKDGEGQGRRGANGWLGRRGDPLFRHPLSSIYGVHRPIHAPDQRTPIATPPEKSSSPRNFREAANASPAKMSWQTYVDEHLMCDIEGHHLASAAILGHDGTVWAQSADFPQFAPAEITAIMKDFDEPGHLAPTGMFVAGAKYMVIQGEPGAVIRGKKGAGGITIKKTGQALVVGAYEEPMTPGQCNMVVERLGDYLVEQGM